MAALLLSWHERSLTIAARRHNAVQAGGAAQLSLNVMHQDKMARTLEAANGAAAVNDAVFGAALFGELPCLA